MKHMVEVASVVPRSRNENVMLHLPLDGVDSMSGAASVCVWTKGFRG